MALFQSYAVIYLAIGAAIHDVLFVFYSYPNDDTETATFDRTVLIMLHCVGYVDNDGLRLSCPSEPDYMEVKKWERETKEADFSKNQNPLYQSPEMKYENVAYGRE